MQQNLSFLIKPASGSCNLRCRYCFYEDETEHRSKKNMGMMTSETVDYLIDEAYRQVMPHGNISFAFQGGEPTLAGVSFFRRFVEQAKRKKPADVTLAFSIQTNGTLMDKQWAVFLKRENFLVGISLDGFKEAHDGSRRTPQGKGTWNLVRRNVSMLQKQGVAVNALCVVTAQVANHPQLAYQELKKLGFPYMQFIACMDPLGVPRGRMPWSLTPQAYGAFLCRIFDLWYADWQQGQYRSIRLFDDYVHALLGDGESTCSTCGKCGAYFVVEGDGSVYPCDFFVMDAWKGGVLGVDHLSDIVHSEPFGRFLAMGEQKPAPCARCQWRKLCNGGCQNDWIQTPDGPQNYFCQSFQMLFEHNSQRIQNIAQAEWRARCGLR